MMKISVDNVDDLTQQDLGKYTLKEGGTRLSPLKLQDDFSEKLHWEKEQ